MSMIDEIKRELPEISRYSLHLEALWLGAIDALTVVSFGEGQSNFIQFKTEAQAKWFKESPERIAAMLKYIEIQERRLKCGEFEWVSLNKELQAARKKLGLE